MGHGLALWKQLQWKQGQDYVYQTLVDPGIRELLALGCTKEQVHKKEETHLSLDR